MSKRMIIMAGLVMALSLLMLSFLLRLPEPYSVASFSVVVVLLSFYLWGVFTGGRRNDIEDRITQGDDPLGQHFNKYEGL